MNLTQITGPFIGSVVLAIVFLLMWRRYRERYLGLWAAASLLWVGRYIYAFAGGQVYLGAHDMVLPALAIARGTLVLWGGFASRKRPMPRLWLAVIGADFALLVYEAFAGSVLIYGFQAVTHYALLGVSMMWAGVLFLGERGERGLESATVCASLVAVGVLHTTFPFSRALGQTFAFLATIVLNVAILAAGFGVLMLYFNRVNRERDALLRKLEVALDKALSGYLPICAHCKSIRDEHGQWSRLEVYLTDKTDAAFSHGICPDCEKQHYGDFLSGGDNAALTSTARR